MNTRLLALVNPLLLSIKNLASGPVSHFKGLLAQYPSTSIRCSVPIHSSSLKLGLMEFFDEKDNWTATEVRVGRAWRKDELRIKSNEDLHKLWYVLLKERNMLLTMEHEFNENVERFPSPERIDKVKESMVNIEEVVRERNRAYYLLETGEAGERPGKLVQNRLGITYFYKCSEHVLPPEKNRRWFATRQFYHNRKETKKFLLYYREKIFLEKRKSRIRERNQVIQLLKRFPDMDMEALQKHYPNVSIESVKNMRKAQGHWVPS